MATSSYKQELLNRLAKQLAAAWRVAGQIDTLDADALPSDREQAYAVQDLMAAELGEALTGWKVGATSAKMRELDGS